MAKGDISGDQYTSVSVIGASNAGLIFRAFSPTLDSEVAIKVLFLDGSHQSVVYLLKEVMIMTELRHFNLVGLKRVYRPGENVCVLVTELMESTLDRLLRSPKKASSEHVKVIMYQVLSGLKRLNAAGVCHTGVSPRSILLSSNCDVKLSSFQGCTQHGEVIRPCEWVQQCMPPGALAGQAIATEAIDVWQAGLVLLSLLIWRDVTVQPATSLVSELRPLLQQAACTVPGPAQSLLSGLLAHDSEQRLTLAEALAHPYFDSLELDVEDIESTAVDLRRTEDETELQFYCCN